MKYIEELVAGSLFLSKDKPFVMSSDFRYDAQKNKHFYCVSLYSGNGQWFKANDFVEHLELYQRDSDGNIQPFKEYPKS
jgi:hypothetical protein